MFNERVQSEALHINQTSKPPHRWLAHQPSREEVEALLEVTDRKKLRRAYDSAQEFRRGKKLSLA